MQTANQKLTPSLPSPPGDPRSLTPPEIRAAIEAGARLVRFEYCLSLLVFTIRRQSRVFLTNSWQERFLRGLGYSLLALVLGPWAVPWGIIWTPRAIWANLSGGADETSILLTRWTTEPALLPQTE